ncbi:MAG: RidA family protein [Deltaproteobacteria bacterium]|nr:RidA family protein [Deltaproteobacteria bacterium]
MRENVATPNAPAAIGPYSQAVKVRAAEMLFCSGQIPLDPATGQVAGGTPAEQARRVMENLRAVVEAAGFSMDDIVKTTIYLADLGSFADVNKVYEGFFPPGSFPARATVQVAALPKGAAVEIDAFAAR